MTYKGIILAGGSGSRLWPITKGVTKQLLPLYDKPIIYYPLSTLMLADIKDILIISTPKDLPNIVALLGDGSQFGINLQYATQEKPNGIAEAFIIGKEFIGDDPVCLILGDNIFHGSDIEKKLELAKGITMAWNGNERAVVFGYEVSDPERYGVAEVRQNFHNSDLYTVVSIEEKPKEPKSNVAVTGLYFYPNEVVRVAESIEPSARGELEITEVNRRFNEAIANDGYTKLDLIMFDRGYAWFDTGTFDSLSEASNYVETIEKRQGRQIACLEEIAYEKGWITKDALIRAGKEMGKNSYGQYLLKIANK